MSDLSNPEQMALDSFRAERDYWKTWVFNKVRGNPAIFESDLRSALDAETDPYPDNKFGIKDRSGLLDEYIANCGGYQQMIWMLMLYPLDVLLRVAPELGLGLPSLPDVARLKIAGDLIWGFQRADDCVFSTPDIDPVFGLPVSEQYEGTVDGIHKTVRRTATVELVDGRAERTWTDWAEVL